MSDMSPAAAGQKPARQNDRGAKQPSARAKDASKPDTRDDGSASKPSDQVDAPRLPGVETITACLAFIIGILVQVGISGLALQRLIRNDTAGFAWAVGIALLATVLFFATGFATFLRRKAHREQLGALLRWFAVVVLAVSVCLTLIVGGRALALRDQPESVLRASPGNASPSSRSRPPQTRCVPKRRCLWS
jgi:hypothetical protein